MSDIDMQRLKACRFVKNNGKVLRAINILRTKFIALTDVQMVLNEDGVEEDEFLDCINFLADEEYIRLRSINGKENAKISDSKFEMLEARVSAKGVRLLANGITDNMVEV